jgi:hypothetical protein
MKQLAEKVRLKVYAFALCNDVFYSQGGKTSCEVNRRKISLLLAGVEQNSGFIFFREILIIKFFER